MTSPARNAPTASEKPAVDAASAVPIAKNPTHRVNRSRSRVSTMRSSVQRTTSRPPATSAAIAASPSPSRTQTRPIPSAPSGPAASAPNNGTTSMRGTMARSWNSRMAIDSRPCGASRSPRSARVRLTMAVEDRAASAP